MNVEQLIMQQADAFEKSLPESVKKSQPSLPAVTVAMAPGSGGSFIAEKVAKRLGYQLYSENLLTAMAHEVDVNRHALESIEKHRPKLFEDFVKSIMPKEDYVYKGDYFEQLKYTVSHLTMVGKVVIVGRGANFIIPLEKRFSIRIVAPIEVRIRNVAFYHKVNIEEAKKRIVNREAKRKAFIKENFHKDIDDHINYDLTINTERMDLETCTECIIGAVKGSQVNRVFEKKSSYILKQNN